MISKRLTKIVMLALLVVMTSCDKDKIDPFDVLGRYSHWSISMTIENKTENKLIIEYDSEYVNEQGQYDHYVHVILKDAVGGAYLGLYDGDKDLECPPEEEVVKKMENVVVYRFMDSVKQYLPRKYFESLSYYDYTDNGWDMGAENVNYRITITEEMFSE